MIPSILRVKRRFCSKMRVKMQIFYETKDGKTVSLEVNPEENMQQVTEKIQDKGGIEPCNVSLMILVATVEILI